METSLLHRKLIFICLFSIFFLLPACRESNDRSEVKVEDKLKILEPNYVYHMRTPELTKLARGCILVTTDYNDKGTKRDRVFLINKRGEILKKWALSFRTKYSFLDTKGNLWLLMNKRGSKGQDSLVTSSWFYKISSDKKVLWSSKFFGAHHKFSVVDEKRIIFPTFSKKKFSYKTEGQYYSDRLVTLNLESGQVESEINLYKLFPAPPEKELNFKFQNTKNIHHVNSIEYYEKDPLFGKKAALISIRNLSKIALIDLEKKKILWQSTMDSLYFGHDARFLANGDILYFNNGNLSSEVLQINPLSQKIVWKFKRRFQFHSHVKSGAQRLSNGNTLILESQKSHLFEVAPTGDILWSILFNFPQNKNETWGPPGINMVEHYDSNYFLDRDLCPES